MNTMPGVQKLTSDEFENSLLELYGESLLDAQKERYLHLHALYRDSFQQEHFQIFSSPGRTELGGNHTDHNNGKVLTASISLDAIAFAAPTDDHIIELVSVGYDELFHVNLRNLDALAGEEGATQALLRGVAAGFRKHGRKIGGFRAAIQSDVLSGSGLSSSAAFEMLVGTILNHLYNDALVPVVEIAKIGQFAENEFFAKPSGLMDQLGCAYGGVIAVDFADPLEPIIEHVEISFQEHGYSLLVVDTGGSHANLTDQYAAIPEEMKKVASYFAQASCRDLDLDLVHKNMVDLREEFGDRAILRCLHFLHENRRVHDMIEAVKKSDIFEYLRLVKESGASSFQYLQNIYSPQDPRSQSVSLALVISDTFLKGGGAFRVHGGGFAGTIQVYVPLEHESEYASYVGHVFGPGCVTAVKIRNKGAIKIL